MMDQSQMEKDGEGAGGRVVVGTGQGRTCS